MDIHVESGIWPFPKRIRTYRGSCTVWHCLETGCRQGTFMEGWLADIAWKAKRERRELVVGQKPPEVWASTYIGLSEILWLGFVVAGAFGAMCLVFYFLGF